MTWTARVARDIAGVEADPFDLTQVQKDIEKGISDSFTKNIEVS